ncbi:Acylphosphatase-1 [Cladochytrium tenue]|nr:Acylphosphatase-1 [Cladochytrium tenue]
MSNKPTLRAVPHFRGRGGRVSRPTATGARGRRTEAVAVLAPAVSPPAAPVAVAVAAEVAMSSSTAAADEDLCWTFEVFGRVQGVSFRKHTVREAERLGLRGWVRNDLRDTGRVFGAATGPREALRALRAWLRAGGPPRARVDRVRCAPAGPADRRGVPAAGFVVVK